MITIRSLLYSSAGLMFAVAGLFAALARHSAFGMVLVCISMMLIKTALRARKQS